MTDAPGPHPQPTLLLRQMREGEPGERQAATAQLWRLLYDELHRLAAVHLRGGPPGMTLQPTALVNEAYLRMCAAEGAEFAGRAPFLALASRVMRSALVDHARARGASKRGGGMDRITLVDALATEVKDLDLLDLDQALTGLSEVDPELERVVELRFFGGLKHPEIAEVMNTSLRTVERQWRLARAWLHSELAEE